MSVCGFMEKVEAKHSYLESLEKKGIIKITQLGNCNVLIKSTTNPDLRIIVTLSEGFDTSENIDVMGSAVKIFYGLIKMIFEEEVNLDEYITVLGGRSGITLKSVIARLYRESKLVPVFQLEVIDYNQPHSSTKTTSAKFKVGYAYVPDSRKLKQKISDNPPQYLPQVSDKIIYLFVSELLDTYNSIQKVYSIKGEFNLPQLIMYLKNNSGNDGRLNLIRSMHLLRIIVELLSEKVRVPLLPPDYNEKTIGKPMSSLISNSIVIINAFMSYPKSLSVLYQKNVNTIGFTLEYAGFKGLFEVWVIPRLNTGKAVGYKKVISSKHINLEGVPIGSIAGKLTPEVVKIISLLTKE